MIGIHDSRGTFSDKWIEVCLERNIPFRRLNCLASDVVQQCAGLDAVLWHWPHNDPTSQLVARQIIASLEARGLLVFPDSKTCWHYDDKIGQKYLLEAVGAPLIPTWVFTSPAEARQWIGTAQWPKVFKLRRGAGSSNVQLVRSTAQAEALCERAFGQGFESVESYFSGLGTRVKKVRNWREMLTKAGRAHRAIANILTLRRGMQRERGYMYFQEFMTANAFDTRITVIGNRAFGFRRMNRPKDFRASGSGLLCYEVADIDPRCVQVAFATADRLQTQSLAFDLLFDATGQVVIGEVSYVYLASAVHACQGHWDRSGAWHAGQVWPQTAILDDLLMTLTRKKAAVV